MTPLRRHPILSTAAVVATSVGLMVAGTTTASANSFTMSVSYGGSAVAEGQWKDGTDQLCARVLAAAPANSNVLVGIGPIGDAAGPEFRWGAIKGEGWSCTQNLSIPEDRHYEMQLWYQTAGGVNKFSNYVQFYT